MFELVFVLALIIRLYLNFGKIKINKIHISAFALIAAYLPLLPRLLHPKFVSTHFVGNLSSGNLARLFVQLNTWIYPSEQLAKKLNSLQFGSFLFSDWILIASTLLLTVFFLIFVLKNFVGNKKIDDNKIFLLLFILIPSILGFVALYKSILTFGSIKYFIFIVPAYFILAANGISSLKSKQLIFFVLLFVFLSTPPLISYYLNPGKPQYRDSVRFIEDNSNSNELIIVNLPSVAVSFQYYSNRAMNVYGAAGAADARKISVNADTLWLVLSTKYADMDGSIKSYFDNNYNLASSKAYHDVRIYHYSKK